MKKNTLSIQSRIDLNNFQLLKKFAKAKGISLSLAVRFILIEYLEPFKEIEGNDAE